MTKQALSDFEVVLVGCGRMGSALVGGAVSAGALDVSRLQLVDASQDAVNALASSLGASSSFVASDRRLVLLAVKPKDAESALRSVALTDDDLVVSVVAGVPLALLKSWTRAQVVRAMPNTPALVGQGITGVLFENEPVDAVVSIFESVGRLVELGSEADFDAVTALSGSGPAFVFTMLEALADGGVLAGLKRETASLLAAQTVLGAATLALESDLHPAALKDAVASPAGTTIAGLAALERHGFRSALIEAVADAAVRSREIGEKLS